MMLDIISVFLNLIKAIFVAQDMINPGECFVFSLLLLHGMVYKYQLDIWSNVSFKSCIFLLVLCLNDLSIGVGVKC